jgi:two-component system, OmpR family, alkaline phosphatase synthesis response regulator PhoP
MKKKHILIIEDDTDIQQLVSYNLIRAGFNVTCADSGEEGLEILDNESFACILLDLMLPGLSGLDVCRQLRQETECRGIRGTCYHVDGQRRRRGCYSRTGKWG